MKDLIHKTVNNKPETIIINLDELAQIFVKIFPCINPLIRSNPPRNLNKLIKTTTCINNFFYWETCLQKKMKLLLEVQILPI